jgi:hypothetical protein
LTPKNGKFLPLTRDGSQDWVRPGVVLMGRYRYNLPQLDSAWVEKTKVFRLAADLKDARSRLH